MTHVSAARYFIAARIHAPHGLIILALVLITSLYLVILNPFGLAFLQGTLNRSGGDLLWEFVATVTGAGLAALLVMAWIECYIRERMLNRRLQAPPPAPREAAPDEFKSAKELPL